MSRISAKLIAFILFLGMAPVVKSQVITYSADKDKDTMYVELDAHGVLEFSNVHKFLYLIQVIPPEIPDKDLVVQLISSNNNEIKQKDIIISGRDIIVPMYLFKDKFYTLYIKKGKQTVFTRRMSRK